MFGFASSPCHISLGECFDTTSEQGEEISVYENEFYFCALSQVDLYTHQTAWYISEYEKFALVMADLILIGSNSVILIYKVVLLTVLHLLKKLFHHRLLQYRTL